MMCVVCMFLYQVIEQLVKRDQGNLGLEFLQKGRVPVAGLDGVLVPEPAQRAADDVLHLAGLFVVLGGHKVQVGLGQVSMQRHARAVEVAVRAVHQGNRGVAIASKQ